MCNFQSRQIFIKQNIHFSNTCFQACTIDDFYLVLNAKKKKDRYKNHFSNATSPHSSLRLLAAEPTPFLCGREALACAARELAEKYLHHQ